MNTYVAASGRARGVIGQPNLKSQRARALRLIMEEGLVAQSLSILGESKICDVGREGVMERLKSQTCGVCGGHRRGGPLSGGA